MIDMHHQLLAAGIKTTYNVPWNLSTQPANIENLASLVGDMEALESPNECDINGTCGGTGLAGIVNLVAFIPTLHAAGNDLHVPVLGPSFVLQNSYTLTGLLTSLIDDNNLHIYFGGRNPGSAGWGSFDPEGNSYGSFSWWLDQAAIDGPTLPSQITETGYMAYPTTSTQWTLPESVEASYMPRTLLLAYMHGYKRTMMYELLDEVSSPGYGLLRSDMSPKPAFTAVSNLMATLADGNTAFTPAALHYQISGGDSTLNHLLLQKQDGSFWLVLWVEQSSWDPNAVRPIAVGPQNISIQLDTAYQTATTWQFDTKGNATPFNQPMTGDTASLTVTDQISIVKIIPR